MNEEQKSKKSKLGSLYRLVNYQFNVLGTAVILSYGLPVG